MSKNITNEQLFEFMTKMYSQIQGEFKEVKNDVKETKKIVMIIEQEHGKKLDALFDGYKQNADKLDRIEKKYLNMKK